MQFHLKCREVIKTIRFHLPHCLFHSYPSPLPKVLQLPAWIFPCGQLHNAPYGLDHPRQPGLLLINGLNFPAALTSQRGSSAPLIREGLPRSPIRQPRASCKIHHKKAKWDGKSMFPFENPDYPFANASRLGDRGDTFIYLWVGTCCYDDVFNPSSKDWLESIQQVGEFICLESNYIIEQSGTAPCSFPSLLSFS